MLSNISKKGVALSAAAVLSFGLIGCGSSSSSSYSDNSEIQIGVFADAPVEGLSYKTATQSGFTDAQGRYKYKDGETVEFKLGTLSLGKGKAGAFVTPYNITDNNTTAVKVALLLQNFDANRSDTKVLNLSKLKDFNFSDDANTRDLSLNLSPDVLENKLSTLLATASFQKHIDEMKHDLIPQTTAEKNMDDYIKQHEAEHNNDTTSPAVDDTFSISNTVPFQAESREDKNNGGFYINKLGGTNQVKAVKKDDGAGGYYAGLELVDPNSPVNIVSGTLNSEEHGSYSALGKYSIRIESDLKAGTEHIVETSEKYGHADCVNQYDAAIPQTIYDGAGVFSLTFNGQDISSTTCPSWINDAKAYSGSIETETIRNFNLVDDGGESTVVSQYTHIVMK